jgi:2-alkenal reductase
MAMRDAWKTVLLSAVLAAALTGCAAPGQPIAVPEIVERAADEAIDLLDRFSSRGPATPDQPRAEPSAAALPEADGLLADLYERVNPSVVNVQVRRRVEVSGPQIPFGFQFPNQPNEGFSFGQGSGFVFDGAGHIVTNYHVVESADQVRVVFTDGTVQEAEIIGTDPDTDLAVVRVDELPAGAHPLVIGDSKVLRVGQQVVAIGNPFGLQGTMTAGIVSALGRTLASQAQSEGGARFSIPNVIQTDAAINPGNSGGPLLNLAGEVVGVNSAIESRSGQFAGVGFAIPSDTVARVIPVLIAEGRFSHPWLGIEGTELTPTLAEALGLDPNQRGLVVIRVLDGSPASKSGLRGSTPLTQPDGTALPVGGDVITQIDDHPLLEFSDLMSYVADESAVGQRVTLHLLRDGKQLTLQVVLAERPTSQN